jgi:6,7-dimethyl-8-ribityllumazine synthase
MSLHSPNHISNEGIQLPTDAFVVIVTTEWNKNIINELESGCIKILEENKIAYHSITVPGAVEIPFAIKYFWENTINKKPHAFISLGCVIRGGTPHFDFVCKLVTEGVLQLNLSLPVPTIFGVLTVDNETQAQERLGGAHGHKGEEAAWTAIKMISLSQSFKN